MSGLFAGTPLERPVTCEVCEQTLDVCTCPRDAQGKVLLPKHQTLRMRMEKRRGKPVTVVDDLDPVANDVAAILKSLKQRCASGGTVGDDGVLELQGEHRETVRGVFEGMGFKVKG